MQNSEQFAEIFYAYPQENVKNLYDGQPRRMKETVRMKGHLSKY